MKKLTIDGNEACSKSAYMFTELAGVYPITPSSPMAEHIDEWKKTHKNIFGEDVHVVEMQSEAGVAGFIHGALQAGCLTTTFTSSQGLLLMIPNMYKIAGEMLPCVIHVAARSLATHALSIFGDHQDIYATRMTGFSILMSSSVQDTNYLSVVAHLSSIESSMPFVHAFDGFRTSHEIDKINTLDLDDIKSIVNYNKIKEFRKKALNPLNPNVKGLAENDDIYFQMAEAKNSIYNNIPNVVNDYMEKINKITGKNYKPFNYYGNNEAIKIIIAMGSVCETIKEFIDHNKEYGLVEVHLYRPFSKEYLINVIPKTVKSIAVIDRTKEHGSIGEPLYLDVVAALKGFNYEIVGGRYGLSSKNTTPAQIKAIYDMLDNPINNFTIGIEDDVTNLSLKIDNYNISSSDEMLIYGYGSDGMISAAKSIIKIIGNNYDKYVQGYFQYDSKKSGGVTLSHLRFSDNPIKSTYYVENPRVIVLTKDTYLNDFDVIKNIRENGIFILNTYKTEEEVNNYISDNIKKILVEKHVKLYIINAYELALKSGLLNKISTIMETVILYLSNIIDYSNIEEKIIDEIKNKFSSKGIEVVNKNIEAIKGAISYIKEVKYDDKYIIKQNKDLSVFEKIRLRQGNEIPVSQFLNIMDGRYECGTSKLEKRKTSEFVPSWINQNCIECNQCSFVCPHSVIKPFLLDENEYNNAPTYVKEKCKKVIGKDNYYFILGISIEDCTGCGLCIKTCPSKEKALISKNIDIELRNNIQNIYNYLSENVKYKPLFNENTVKGSQFKESKFMFHGACAGCGETAYIKILTQMFGDSLIIANATGCSSIYGGSMPSIPYTIPWINSLFEDNAEFGFGILNANNYNRLRIKGIMQNNLDNKNGDLFKEWIDNYDNYEITKKVYDNIDYNIVPKELVELKDYIPSRVIFSIGGDGWAYDIGYSGIDHVLASNQNVNILVLDTEVYSNTGGQSSKSSTIGSIAAFTSTGKKTNKKDLARLALSYSHVYVAHISIGANYNQVLKVFKEAVSYNGPSIIIAYSTCISHGIKGGMINSLDSSKLAVECGYFPLFHYNPLEKKFHLDYKNVNFDMYEEFLNSQTRFSMLKVIEPENYEDLLEKNKQNAIERFEYYKNLSEK
ncbi:MAG: pyruvate:ferredoxin (flavodoxin) oxidoreductase [Clostridium sp.]|nr:pyruvate:ferredoxin (flavodoxin) oxidoreductase [Clostridium sp.]MCM1444292.1 pyruvate:ferredoxin (flavodoxin) oxidoreductase [Candidatus Amulumruptor caecigallinarius]